MMGKTFIQIRPAYGRSYTTMKQVFCDWINNKDFQILGQTSYINRSDRDKHAPEARVVIKLDGVWENIYKPNDHLPDFAFLRPDGDIIHCYGSIRDDSNFSICCDDEEYDGIWADGDPDSPEGYFKSWEPCVKYLLEHYRSDISQIESC